MSTANKRQYKQIINRGGAGCRVKQSDSVGSRGEVFEQHLAAEIKAEFYDNNRTIGWCVARFKHARGAQFVRDVILHKVHRDVEKQFLESRKPEL